MLDELAPCTVSILAHTDRCSQPTMTDVGQHKLAAVRDRNAVLVAERIAA